MASGTVGRLQKCLRSDSGQHKVLSLLFQIFFPYDQNKQFRKILVWYSKKRKTGSLSSERYKSHSKRRSARISNSDTLQWTEKRCSGSEFAKIANSSACPISFCLCHSCISTCKIRSNYHKMNFTWYLSLFSARYFIEKIEVWKNNFIINVVYTL